jgi:hypothetical protein
VVYCYYTISVGGRMERGGHTAFIRPAERLAVWYPMVGGRARSRAW